MADDVPVCDVLCEAMEYLSKLGSNLRVRSDSLKEKKIRKDKLKNAHAVLKAAKKVLLICELSKKSLENVETGVKRILSVVDASQAGDGGKSSKRSSTESRHSSNKYSSESRKENNLSSPKSVLVSGKKYHLRIPKKINLKHYQSVKVLARAMPKSMIVKYPVYYRCKLLHRRERESLKNKESNTDSGHQKSERKHSESSGTNESKDNVNGTVTTEKGREENNCETERKRSSNESDNESSSKINNVKNTGSNKGSKNESESTDDNNKEGKAVKDKSCIKNKDKCPESKSVSSDEISQENSQDKVKDDKSSEKQEQENKGSHSEKQNEKYSHKHQRCQIYTSSDDDSKKESLRRTKKSKQDKSPHKKRDKHKLQSEDSSDNDNSKVVTKKHKKEKTKRIQIIDDSSEEEVSKEKCTETDIVMDLPEDKISKENTNQENIVSEENKNVSLKDDSADKNEHLLKTPNEEDSSQGTLEIGENVPAKENKPTKPLIKCVSLDRLLKPDILGNKKDIPTNKSPRMVVHMNTKGELQTRPYTYNECYSNSNFAKNRKQKKEDEYWDEKRKEVAAFKPKLFSIQVVKLPTLSVEFLKKNNLRRILRNDSTVCEIPTNNADSQLVLETDSREVDLTEAVTNEAKNALLDDSDSEQLETPPSNKQTKSSSIGDTETIKNSLLNDSDSDKNDEEEELQEKSSEDNPPESQKTKEKSLEDASASNEQVTCSEKDDKDEEVAKSALLNDSSSSGSKSPSDKKRKDESHVKYRMKHKMESIHAKRMLLTCSSSSDTEDEHLKNVINNIKDNLIKSIDNEEDKMKNAKTKLLSNSDSDEEDIVKQVEKKRKTSEKSHSSDAEDKKENAKKKLLCYSDSDDEDIVKQVKKKRKTSEETHSPDAELLDADKDDESLNGHNNDTTSNDASNSAVSKSKSSRKMGRSRKKRGDSSSLNSDSQEEKDIEGLTNLKSLSKARRRRDSDSDVAGSTHSTSTRSSTLNSKKDKMSKKLISGEEGLVEATLESSDEASAVESEGADEDLPPITLPGLNGSGIEHMAKDDLLGDSESDSSKEKSSDEKKEDSDTDALKSKRRKANTISSDSEAGSSRPKKNRDEDARVSDFEDSEDDSSEPVKRSKRKKKGSDSDASGGSSNEGKKKRRRIKTLDSDASESDSENEGKSKHGRKNIRKVMGKNQLEEATKKAARQEKERVARIAERQKMYNNLAFDESGKPDEVIVDKVVLDFDPETKEPLIEVDKGLVKKLKPHQANGIKFMWDACFESAKRIKKDKGSGCILAHCMGLGKTLQVVTLTHTLLVHSDLTRVNRVLVVCPLSTVLNWVNEFNIWLKHTEKDYEVDVYELSKFKQNSERAFQLTSWFKHGGVCVLGYEMFRNLSADNPKKFKKKMLKQFQEALVDPGPDLVVCDEGHLLKNEKTSLSQSMNRVKTLRRIVLTGTPLQNNLKEYYCMVQFVKPNLLGKYNEYLNRFVNPITNGQYTDSTEHDIKIMKRRSHVLHKMLDGAVQRRDYGVLAPFLPPKHEYVLFITLTEVQIKLYQHYLDNYSRRPLPGKSSGFLFPDFQSLQRIWTHPLVLKYNSERYEIMQQKKREREEEEDSEGSLVDFIDDDSTPSESTTEDESDSLSELSDDSRKKSKKKKSAKKSKTKDEKKGGRRNTRANPVELEEPLEDPDILEVKNDNPTEWWIPLVTDDEIEDMRNSHKLVLLFEILRQCEAIGDKLLVFSQSLYSLDLIEHFLGKVDEATQEGRIDEKLGGHVGSWSPGIDYFRLDGSTSCENRSIWCKNFNREDNPRARLFLISTRAGGLGINLVAANRVVIFDVSWNPSHDVQSIFRVYRFGQKKPCYIYRFLAMGTMEEKIYERQVTKQAISKRVIDEQQIDRHYAENDLAELYKFEPRPPEPRPVPLVPKDRLFAEMLIEREHVIYKYHEHDSLLENKEEETLSEEERKAAWDDFENEKNRPPPQPFPSWPMHNGMVPNLMAQQQQQLAYAALAQMLRKDMPGLTDDNIRAMLPLIYSSNPAMFGGYDYGLMQKLTGMYAQPGMMNPAMMNPGMNVGAGSGVGGSSGLQYEPPWQRQQQQQQQMRMQQLMQHQHNPMGAKFYAGGLGSRDPVAMALQQQRAREIMLSGGGGASAGAVAGVGSGRPRGRPPLQPRVPLHTTAPADVVNLDSD